MIFAVFVGLIFYIRINGNDKSLQQAIKDGDLKSITSGGSYSGTILFGQKGEEILGKVNNVENNLQYFINNGGLCSSTGSYGSYSTPVPDPGHYGTKVNIINVSGVEKSLQSAIDDQEFC